MRFAQVPIGTRFEFEGELYLKTGPLIAHREPAGRPRMIPRFAEVQLLSDAIVAAPVVTSAATAQDVLAGYHAECLRVLEELAARLDAAALRAARDELEAAHRKAQAQLAPGE
jgi:hypothetical protein